MSLGQDDGYGIRPKLRRVKRSKAPAAVVMRRVKSVGSKPKPRSSEKSRA